MSYRIKPKSPRALMKEKLAQLEHILINSLVGPSSPIEEGRVMTAGPTPYRRLDLGGRALAYVKRRPQKRAVRIDISGLWKQPRASRLQIPTASGATTLLVQTEEDIQEAIAFIMETVVVNRRLEAA